MIHDAVIIGGGLSGLSAAVRISAGGGRVALFEQASRLDERTLRYVGLASMLIGVVFLYLFH